MWVAVRVRTGVMVRVRVRVRVNTSDTPNTAACNPFEWIYIVCVCGVRHH